MITHIELSTFKNNSFKLDIQRTNRDISGTYFLIRYKLPPDNPNIWRAVANNWVTIYMSELEYMSPNLYMGGFDLEHDSVEKVVTDVSDILRFYDTIIDNTNIDKDGVYAYCIVAKEDGTEYRTKYVVGYIENEIHKFSKEIRPTLSVNWMKHRGVADYNIVNKVFSSVYTDIMYYEIVLNEVINKNNKFIDKIKVNDILDKLEKVAATYEMLRISLPTKDVTKRLGWGISRWGVDNWGFVEITLELGFPYNFR